MNRSQMPNYPRNEFANQRFQPSSIYGGMNSTQSYDNRGYENQNSNRTYEDSVNSDDHCDDCNWKFFKIFYAEVIGTAIMIYIGCMSCTAFGFGFGLLIAAQTFGHISGAFFNPAISIAAVIMGRIKFKMFPLYVLAQFVGGFVGYGLHYINNTALLGYTACPTIVIGITSGQAVLIEALATAFLAMVSCSFWDKDNSNNDATWPMKVALLLVGLIMATAKFTGASFNIARSFPPAVFYELWLDHWVYWVGPNIGGAIGALFYRTAISNKKWKSCY